MKVFIISEARRFSLLSWKASTRMFSVEEQQTRAVIREGEVLSSAHSLGQTLRLWSTLTQPPAASELMHYSTNNTQPSHTHTHTHTHTPALKY